MKQVFFYCLLFSLTIVTGCQNRSNINNNDMQVTLVGISHFPNELVGKWKEKDEGVWEINFLDDGTISKATIEFAEIELSPGKTTEFPTWYEGKGIFESGKWSVEYDNATRSLTVEIKIDHFYQDISKDAIEGERTDLLIGSVVDSNTIEMDWMSTYKFYAKLRDSQEAVQFEDQKEPIFKRTIILKKIE